MKNLNSISQNQFGKDFYKITKSQRLLILAENKLESIIDLNGENINKLASINKGINEDALNKRLILKYGGYNSKYFTDSELLIADKEISQKIYDLQFAKEAKKESLKKDNRYKNESYQDIFDGNLKYTKNKTKKYEKDFPIETIEKLISKNYNIKGEIIGHFVERSLFTLIQTENKINIIVNTDKLAFMLKYLPNTEMFIKNELKSIQFIKNGKIQGLLMPILNKDLSIPEKLLNYKI